MAHIKQIIGILRDFIRSPEQRVMASTISKLKMDLDFDSASINQIHLVLFGFQDAVSPLPRAGGEGNSSWAAPLFFLTLLFYPVRAEQPFPPQFLRSTCACWGRREDVGSMEQTKPWWLIVWKTKKRLKVFEGQVLPGNLWTSVESSL